MSTEKQEPARGRNAPRRQQGDAEKTPPAVSEQAPGTAPGPARRRPERPQGERVAAAAPPAPPKVRVIPSLLVRYRSEIAPALRQEFGYQNALQAPRVVKVVLNVGLSEALTNPRATEMAGKDLTLISGQHPVVTKAKKDIAGFKVRAGQPVGVMVTLRGDRMYSFLERLIEASLPRIRDFRGIPRDAFDGRGNYSLGLREHIVFPEIEYGQVDRIRGLQVNIVTNARNDREAFRLLELFRMPFAREGARVAG